MPDAQVSCEERECSAAEMTESSGNLATHQPQPGGRRALLR